MQDNIVPVKDTISVDQAITLIKGHRHDRPTILPSKLRLAYRYIHPNTNITLFQAELGTMKNGRKGAVATAPIFVRVKDSLEAEVLKSTIKEKIRELSGKEFEPTTTVARKTVHEEGNEVCHPTENPEPQAKIGQEIRA